MATRPMAVSAVIVAIEVTEMFWVTSEGIQIFTSCLMFGMFVVSQEQIGLPKPR